MILKFGLSLVLVFGVLSAHAYDPQEIYVPVEVSENLKSFEPSAALYLEDLDLFLVASDDTTKDDEPLLFLIDQYGQVESPAIKIKGIDVMTDIESISQGDDGILYLMSSQGLNKNGEDLPERNMFVRAERKDRKVKAIDWIYLRPILLENLQNSEWPELAGMSHEFEEKLDVESHFTRDGELYLGLKEPQPQPGTAVIVKAGNIENLFSNGELSLEVWRTIDFAAITGEADRLSDILIGPDAIYLTTAQDVGPGRFWRYEEISGELTLLEEYRDLHAEGLAYHPSQNACMIVFDEGEDAAQFSFRPF